MKAKPPQALPIRQNLTPQMADYTRFSDRGSSAYLPYVMSFNRLNFRSDAINTDSLGFRYAHTTAGEPISVGDLGSANHGPVSLLVGSSAALGYGSSSDATSLASRLAAKDPQGTPWLNFSGHCFNSAQELLLYIMHQPRLPPVQRITIMGGFNTLVMARLPEFQIGGLPPFYFCGEYYEKFDEMAVNNGGEPSRRALPRWPSATLAVPPIEQTINEAAKEVLARLKTWSQLAETIGAEVEFLLQPLATWVRKPSEEEKKLFDELDKYSHLGTWDELYGDISDPNVAISYGEELKKGSESLNIPFNNLADALKGRPAKEWLYVDRAHFTDLGNDIIASTIQEGWKK